MGGGYPDVSGSGGAGDRSSGRDERLELSPANEMPRNIVSKRPLSMPREHVADKDKPFDEVRHTSSPARPG